MKTLITCFLTYLITCLVAVGLQAQDHRQKTPEQQQAHQERMQKIRNAKIAYLTEKLNLNPEQAQKFWPVYNQYESERDVLRRKSRKFRDNNIETMSEQEVREGLNTRFDIREAELDLEKQYMDKFMRVLSIKQVAVLYRSEREFTEVLLKKLDAQRQHTPQAH